MGQQTSLARTLNHSAPQADGDFYRIANLLDESESTIVKRVRDFMECEIAPIIDDYWARDKFPFEVIPKLAALGIGGVGYQGYGSAGGFDLSLRRRGAEAALAASDDAVRDDRVVW